MLVVMGIILVLLSILMPVVLRAQRKADIVRMRADLNTIGVALEAYKADFGEYPGQSAKLGDHMLARALIGPGDELPVGGVDSRGFHADGADGLGFRAVAGGKIWPPYLPIEKFKVQGVNGFAGQATGTTDILDRWGYPILYYPQRKIWSPGKGPLVSENTEQGIFDVKDGDYAGAVDSTKLPPPVTALELRHVLGDLNANNRIDASETLTYSGPYILASAGPNKFFLDSPDTDDIFNFDKAGGDK
jgi:type II secretory pathway pseudopilin PulG